MKADITQREALQRILSHDSVFATASDDGVKNEHDFATFFLTHPEYIVIIPDRDAAILFRQQNMVCFEMHVAFISGYARKRLKEYSVPAIKWLLENTKAEKIISMIPEYHEPSLVFARVGGMETEGIIKDSFMKDGVLHNMVLLGMSKARFYQLHGGE